MLSSLWHGLIASGNVIIRNEHNSRIQCYVWHKVHNILWAPWRHISISLLPPSASGDQGIGLVWDSHPNWTKLSMMGPQLFSGWYQMILDVFQCSQLFSDVFSWVVTFMDKPGCPPHLPRNIASICGKIGIHARFATFVLTPCCSTYTSITVAAKKLATRFATCVLTPFIAQQKPHKT